MISAYEFCANCEHVKWRRDGEDDWTPDCIPADGVIDHYCPFEEKFKELNRKKESKCRSCMN